MKRPYEIALKERRTFTKFPNDTWDTVADVPIGARVLDGGVLKQKLQYFNNEGVDFVDFGRPANVVDHIRPSIDEFTMRFLFRPILSSAGALMSLMNSPIGQRFAVETTATNQLKVWVGGTQTTFSGATYSSTTWNVVVLKYTTTQVRLFLNGVEASNVGAVGTGQHTQNLLLFGDFTGSSFNYNGDGGFVDFYSGVGDFNSYSIAGQTELDCFDFTKPALWDGGPTMVSEKGTVGTFTKGVPLTERQYDLIPVSMKC